MLNDLLSALFACAWLSLFAFPFALIPASLLAVFMSSTGRSWTIAHAEIEKVRKVPFWKISAMGGILGECVAVCSLFLSTEWSCIKGEQLCHDGQAGMVLIVTVPLFSLLGSAFALAWTRVTLRISHERVFASVFSYKGSRKALNRALAIMMVFSIWIIAMFVASAPFLQM